MGEMASARLIHPKGGKPVTNRDVGQDKAGSKINSFMEISFLIRDHNNPSALQTFFSFDFSRNIAHDAPVL